MRLTGAILSTATLLWGLYQAPFLHIHPEDLDHPPTPALVHLHVHATLPSSTNFISAHTDDDDAVDVGWNPVQPSSLALSFDFIAAETAHIPPLVRASVPLPVPLQRGHDPPGLTPEQPRAPPA